MSLNEKRVREVRRAEVFKTFDGTGSITGLLWVGICGCGLRIRTGSWRKAYDRICSHLRSNCEDFHP